MRMPVLTVQQRISLAVAILVSAALAITGLTVYFIESRRVDASIETAIANELEGLRRYAPNQAVDQRLTSYLQSSFPRAGTAMWAFKTDGSVSFVGPESSDLQKDAKFPTRIRAAFDAGGVFDFESGGDTYRVGVLPVHAGDNRAALVVTVNEDIANAELRELMITYALLATLSLMVVVSLSSLIAARALAPLRELRNTAKTITEGSLGDRIDVTGKDDLADLQRSFNSMLDRIEAAMQAQRGMLDDAAHELRTPLTIIRGQIELLDLSDPADAEATKVIVMDEIDRMGRLVSDLLILAKTDRQDFVRPAPANVADILHSVLAKVSPLVERHWLIDAELDEVVDLDEQRIVQALVQLVDNAIKHTGDGDVIALGAQRRGTMIEFWVRDSGAGVDPSQREKIFERFAQADPESAGFGLGLTIVSAIVSAHGGDLSLDPADPNAPGATFRFGIDAGGQP